MICEFEPHYEGRLENPVTVRCDHCGRQITTRTFPVRAECSMTPLREFLADPFKVQEAKKRFGLGDLVELGIKVATFGLVKPKEGCGCDERKKKWNDFLSVELP